MRIVEVRIMKGLVQWRLSIYWSDGSITYHSFDSYDEAVKYPNLSDFVSR